MSARLPKVPVRRLVGIVGKYEKYLLAALSVVIVVTGTIWFRQAEAVHNGQPIYGGTYVEGIVGTQSDAEVIASKITKAGLFTFDKTGELHNQLVSNWTVNSDATEYHFNLLSDVNAQEIYTDLQLNSDAFGQAIINHDGQDISFKLAVSDPDLPMLLTQPLFNYGPYKLSRITNESATLVRNTRKDSVSPYIDRVIIRYYSNQNDLEQALNQHKVDGATINDTAFTGARLTKEQINLPKYYAVVFNLNRAPFTNTAFSQKVSQNKPASGGFTLIAPDQEPYKKLAQNYVKLWKKNGLSVTLTLKSLNEIQQNIEPTRNFQALMTGIDYGADLDPYYIWSSTQVRPPDNNISGIKDSGADATLATIRKTLNADSRYKLIATLHKEITAAGAAIIFQQEQSTFYIGENVHYTAPVLPLMPNDKWQSIAWWWLG